MIPYDMHTTVRQLFARAKNPIYDFKSFRYYLNKIQGIPKSFYDALWNNSGKQASGKVPFLQYFYSHNAKPSLWTRDNLISQYGNCYVGFINHDYKKNTSIDNIDGLDIYDYVMSPEPITDKTDFNLFVDDINVNTNLSTFSTISLKIGGHFMPAFLMKDFYIYQCFEAWPVMYFKSWKLAGLSVTSNTLDCDDKQRFNGVILHNPLYDYYYLVIYYWGYDRESDDTCSFTLDITRFIPLRPNICELLSNKAMLHKVLDRYLPSYYLTDFQVPYWHYGSHSYIYKKNYDGSSRKSYLPLVSDLLEAAYSNKNIYNEFLDYVQQNTRQDFISKTPCKEGAAQ